MPDKDPPTDGSSVNRRSFFRRMMIRGVEKFEESGREMADKFARITGTDEPAASPGIDPAAYWPQTRYLRPPGALPFPLFESECTQCGDCIEACPAKCIKVDEQADNDDGEIIGGGFPYIDARQSPCVVCDDLSCMRVCPTDALQLVEDVKEINMGIAAVNDTTCLRGPYGDQEDCTICVDRCPIGEEAIGLDPHHAIIEVRESCIGCGVCESSCPTEPASIWVEPHNDW